jgi:hypothetical protein
MDATGNAAGATIRVAKTIPNTKRRNTAMNYVKCPRCDLNYIQAGEKYCGACDPKRQDKLISTATEAYEARRYTKLNEYEARKQSMEAYYAYRFNRKPKF